MDYDFFNTKYSEEQIKGFIKNNNKDLDYDFWCDISGFQVLSEDFIREFKDKLNWYCISRYQTLSEPFMLEFKDKVAWNYISEFQTLSEPFMLEFIKYIKIGNEDYWGLKDNKKISEDVKKRIIDLKNLLEKG